MNKPTHTFYMMVTYRFWFWKSKRIFHSIAEFNNYIADYPVDKYVLYKYECSVKGVS